jgi:hypothetical protein
LPLHYVPRFLQVHKAKLDRRRAAEGLDLKTVEVRRGINTSRHHSVALALDVLRYKSQTSEQLLLEGIPGIAYIEEAEPSSNGSLSGRVANQVRREGLERPDKPGWVTATDPEVLTHFADEQELVAFAYRELVARKAYDAGLSQQELESWVLGELFGN